MGRVAGRRGGALREQLLERSVRAAPHVWSTQLEGGALGRIEDHAADPRGPQAHRGQADQGAGREGVDVPATGTDQGPSEGIEVGGVLRGGVCIELHVCPDQPSPAGADRRQPPPWTGLAGKRGGTNDVELGTTEPRAREADATLVVEDDVAVAGKGKSCQDLRGSGVDLVDRGPANDEHDRIRSWRRRPSANNRDGEAHLRPAWASTILWDHELAAVDSKPDREGNWAFGTHKPLARRGTGRSDRYRAYGRGQGHKEAASKRESPIQRTLHRPHSADRVPRGQQTYLEP